MAALLTQDERNSIRETAFIQQKKAFTVLSSQGKLYLLSLLIKKKKNYLDSFRTNQEAILFSTPHPPLCFVQGRYMVPYLMKNI